MSCSVIRKFRPWLEVEEVAVKAKESALFVPTFENRDYSFVKILTKDHELHNKVCIAELRMAKNVDIGDQKHIFLEENYLIAAIDEGSNVEITEVIKPDIAQFLAENNVHGSPEVEDWHISGRRLK